MKVKSLFFCLIAVFAVTLSSCDKDNNKDKVVVVNYADDFKGTYTMTMKPSISMKIVGIESETPIESIEVSGKCVIASAIKDKTVVTLYDENDTPMLLFAGTCDNTGMHLSSYDVAQEDLYLGEELGYVSMNITLGSATVAKPTNGVISWATALTGTIGMEKEVAPGFSVPVEAELSGNMNFSGTKQ